MKRILGAVVGLSAPLLALATPAMAAPRDDVLYGISRCGAIADDRTWLDCIYGAAQPMRSQLGLSPAPAGQQKLVPPAPTGIAAPAAQTFGVQAPAAAAYKPTFLERMITPHHDEAERPTTMISYKFDGAGFFTVKLANGESWSQDEGDSARAHWTKKAPSYTVQIEPTSSTYHRLKVGPEVFLVNKD